MEDEKTVVTEDGIEVTNLGPENSEEGGLDLTSLGIGALAAGAIYGIYRGAKWIKEGKDKRIQKQNEKDLAKIEKIKARLAERNCGLPEEDMNPPEPEEEETTEEN